MRPTSYGEVCYYRAIGDSAYGHLEAEGTLPPWHAAAVPTPIEQGNVIRKEGKYWSIQYHQQVVHVPDHLGWRYIVQLIRSEGREFHGLDLVAAARDRQPNVTHPHDGRLSADQLGDMGLSVFGLGDAGPLLDPETLRLYQQQRQDDREELREAEEANDLERAAEIRARIDWLDGEVARAVGRGGRIRRASDPLEKARKSVSLAIGRALGAIKTDHPALYEHLDTSLKRGDFFVYDPPTSPRWRW